MATTYFTASSLDGFIADPEHTLSWLLSRDVDPRGPMGHGRFLAERVGAIVMGRTTYDWILAHEADEAGSVHWPYDVPCWVFTTREPTRVSGDVRFVRGPVAAVHPELLAAAGEQDVWVVGGGELAAQLADAGLLDEVWVQYAPVTLGAGSPLLPRSLELRLVETVRNRDFVCARYAVVGPQPPGGGRASGTDDEAGSILDPQRWTRPRSTEQTSVPATDPRSGRVD